MKPFWQSKTLWTNAVALGAMVAKHYLGVSAIPDVNPTVLAVANLVLRIITKQPVSL